MSNNPFKALLLMFSLVMKCQRESTYCIVVSLLLPSAKYVLETNHVVSKKNREDLVDRDYFPGDTGFKLAYDLC